MTFASNALDKKKLQLEYLEALRLAAYTSFNDRRSYEWKLSLSVWTALAILIAGLLQPGQPNAVFPFHGGRYVFGAILVGLAVVALHIYYSNGIARANTIDRNKDWNYSHQIEAVLNLPPTPRGRYVRRLVGKVRKPVRLPKIMRHEFIRPELIRRKLCRYPRLRWMQWGHITQIAMTILLVAIAAILFSIRAVKQVPPPAPTSVTALGIETPKRQ